MSPIDIRLTDFEVPNLGDLPSDYQDLLDLINLGKYEWIVQLYNYEFKMGSLWEWEWREIYRKLSGLDLLAKDRLIKVEVLTKAIIEIKSYTTNKTWEFKEESQKVILRHLLLSMDKKVIDDLYDGFNYGEEIALKKFREKLEDIRRRVKSDFFVDFGSY
jgi:hypothetical protein